jgi:hypothetical protein
MRNGLVTLFGRWHAAAVAVVAVVTLTVAGGTAAMAAADAAVPSAAATAAGNYAEFYDVATQFCLDSNAAGNVYTNPCQAPGRLSRSLASCARRKTVGRPSRHGTLLRSPG